jgi:hypothetical protein
MFVWVGAFEILKKLGRPIEKAFDTETRHFYNIYIHCFCAHQNTEKQFWVSFLAFNSFPQKVACASPSMNASMQLAVKSCDQWCKARLVAR